MKSRKKTHSDVISKARTLSIRGRRGRGVNPLCDGGTLCRNNISEEVLSYSWTLYISFYCSHATHWIRNLKVILNRLTTTPAQLETTLQTMQALVTAFNNTAVVSQVPIPEPERSEDEGAEAPNRIRWVYPG
jgi:hypothetical protein